MATLTADDADGLPAACVASEMSMVVGAPWATAVSRESEEGSSRRVAAGSIAGSDPSSNFGADNFGSALASRGAANFSGSSFVNGEVGGDTARSETMCSMKAMTA